MLVIEIKSINQFCNEALEYLIPKWWFNFHALWVSQYELCYKIYTWRIQTNVILCCKKLI